MLVQGRHQISWGRVARPKCPARPDRGRPPCQFPAPRSRAVGGHWERRCLAAAPARGGVLRDVRLRALSGSPMKGSGPVAHRTWRPNGEPSQGGPDPGRGTPPARPPPRGREGQEPSPRRQLPILGQDRAVCRRGPGAGRLRGLAAGRSLEIGHRRPPQTRQWLEVLDFVARFCTLRESENTRSAAQTAAAEAAELRRFRPAV